jgi:hypothetical protein
MAHLFFMKLSGFILGFFSKYKIIIDEITLRNGCGGAVVGI